MQQRRHSAGRPVELTARYYDGTSTDSIEVRLNFVNAGLLTVSGPGVNNSYNLSKLNISSRLGNTPRTIGLPNGGKCEVSDNDLLDQLLGESLPPSTRWLHRLESHTAYVLLAVILTLFTTYMTVEHGIPWLASRAAHALPLSVDRNLGQGALKILDKTLLEASTLDTATRQRLQDRFARMTTTHDGDKDYQLEFRGGGDIGANAFALPSGIVVMTDELVELSENDDELVAILAHEIGHLEHRHSIRMAMQSSAVTLVIATITGDVVSTSTLIVALPTILIHSSYSQEFEHEADDYAYRYLVSNGIETAQFAHILERITGGGDTDAVEKYLSSHPGTNERTARFTAGAAVEQTENLLEQHQGDPSTP